jgi:hypothetical protein
VKCFKKWRERRKRKAHKVENGNRESVARATFWHQAKFGIKFNVHEVVEKWQSEKFCWGKHFGTKQSFEICDEISHYDQISIFKHSRQNLLG